MPRAVVIERPGGPEVLKVVELPAQSVKPGDVRVEVYAAGANPVDAGNRADPAWARVQAPFVVGYEFAGEVSEIGAEVQHLDVGDAVWGLLPVRGTRWGAYAEEIVIDARLVTRRPSQLNASEAAALPLAGATALQLLDRLAPQPHEWMLVHGAAGGVGHLLVQLAHARGVRVVAPARPSRHAVLRRLGVEVIVERDGNDPVRSVREAIGGDVAMVADLVGSGLLAASLGVIAEGGRAASIVDMSGDLENAIDRNVTVHGVLVRTGRAVLDALAALVEAGQVRPIVDGVIELEQARRAHERLETGSGQGKLVLDSGRGRDSAP
jgi:NADPH2:quinone reductase